MSDLPDITEGAAKRLEAWLDSWHGTSSDQTASQLMADLDWAVRYMERGTPGALLSDVREAADALIAHLDEREVA